MLQLPGSSRQAARISPQLWEWSIGSPKLLATYVDISFIVRWHMRVITNRKHTSCLPLVKPGFKPGRLRNQIFMTARVKILEFQEVFIAHLAHIVWLNNKGFYLKCCQQNGCNFAQDSLC